MHLFAVGSRAQPLSVRHSHAGGERPATCLQLAELDSSTANMMAWKRGRCPVCAPRPAVPAEPVIVISLLFPVDAASLFPGILCACLRSSSILGVSGHPWKSFRTVEREAAAVSVV